MEKERCFKLDGKIKKTTTIQDKDSAEENWPVCFHSTTVSKQLIIQQIDKVKKLLYN